MAETSMISNGITGELNKVLIGDDIKPGDAAGYAMCKSIFEYHPLGGKLAEQPITMATSQRREISIPGSPEAAIKKRFWEVWAEIGADASAHQTATIARVYGIAALVVGAQDIPSNEPMTPEQIQGNDLYLNAADPLNAAGSLVLNQDPSAPDFLKPQSVTVGGNLFHKSRAVIIMNEMPLYLGWTPSAFGFSGRSVYQRCLYPLRSYLSVMEGDDMVARKAGLLVMKAQQETSMANNLLAGAMRKKREKVKLGRNNEVLSIGPNDEVASLDLHNVGDALDTAFTRIKETIAAGAGMPAILVNQQTFAQGFGEGSEDAKAIAAYIEWIRGWMQPIYNMLDRICLYRTLTPEFYAGIQAEYTEYASVSYEAATQRWRNAFTAKWPSYLREPESEKVNVEKVKFEAILAASGALLPTLDAENKTRVIMWVQDCLNASTNLIPTRLEIDAMGLEEWLVEKQIMQPDEDPMGGDKDEVDPERSIPVMKP